MVFVKSARFYVAADSFLRLGALGVEELFPLFIFNELSSNYLVRTVLYLSS